MLGYIFAIPNKYTHGTQIFNDFISILRLFWDFIYGRHSYPYRVTIFSLQNLITYFYIIIK